MLANTIIAIVILVGLAIGSYTDIKKREVPDWLSYSMIAAGLGIRLLHSAQTNDWMYLVHGLIGFAVFFGLSCLMFYTGQWGGGDAKMLMGLGILIGFDLSFNSLLLGLIVNILLIGAVYGIIWAAVLAIRNWKSFAKELSALRSKMKLLEIIMAAVLAFSLIFALIQPYAMMKLMIIMAGAIPALSFYLWAFAKAVENSCMLKYVSPKELTEGDWIAKNIMSKGKIIAGPKDLGIEKAQIILLAKLKVRKVLVKYGIPFIPSFLLAYILTLAIYYLTGISNWFLALI